MPWQRESTETNILTSLLLPSYLSLIGEIWPKTHWAASSQFEEIHTARAPRHRNEQSRVESRPGGAYGVCLEQACFFWLYFERFIHIVACGYILFSLLYSALLWEYIICFMVNGHVDCVLSLAIVTNVCLLRNTGLVSNGYIPRNRIIGKYIHF